MPLEELQMLKLMLAKQEALNTAIHPEWRQQRFNWPRAIWMEVAELMERLPWKWWKSPPAEDLDQTRLELVDVFHFGMSALLQYHTIPEAAALLKQAQSTISSDRSLMEACDYMVASAAATSQFNASAFWTACHAVGLSLDQLFEMYAGKHLLNEFRAAHGYNTGAYRKYWFDGREDNEHLQDAMRITPNGPSYLSDVAACLARLYAAK